MTVKFLKPKMKLARFIFQFKIDGHYIIYHVVANNATDARNLIFIAHLQKTGNPITACLVRDTLELVKTVAL